MSQLEYIIIGLFGLVIGSFLNVCIYRIPAGESIAFPPSHCSACGHSLSAPDLVPVFSYLLLHGKCRYCSEKISVQYPLIEIITSVMGMMVYARFGFTGEAAVSFVLGCLLIMVCLIDYRHLVIPNKINILIAIVGGISTVILGRYEIIHSIQQSLFGALLGGGSLYLMGLLAGMMLHKKAMGLGDVKLMTACGLVLGMNKTLYALMIAFYIAAALIIVLMVMKKLNRNQRIPFGPFLAIGTMIANLCF